MEVICIEDTAFYKLIEVVVEKLTTQHGQPKEKWIPPHEAMQLLNIKSKTSLQALRDNGKIRFSQPQKKVILYDRESILTYLEENAQNTF